MRLINLSKDEKELLRLYRKVKEKQQELVAKAKEKELREFVIDKMTKNCIFHEDCPWCKMKEKP